MEELGEQSLNKERDEAFEDARRGDLYRFLQAVEYSEWQEREKLSIYPSDHPVSQYT